MAVANVKEKARGKVDIHIFSVNFIVFLDTTNIMAEILYKSIMKEILKLAVCDSFIYQFLKAFTNINEYP